MIYIDLRSVNGQGLERVDSQTVAAGAAGTLAVRVTHEGAEWQGVSGFARFERDRDVYDVPISADGTAVVPWEVCQWGGFYVSLWGDAGNGKRLTTERVFVRVEKSLIESDAAEPIPSTPSLLERYERMVQSCIDIADSVRDDANAGKFNGTPFRISKTYASVADMVADKNPGVQNGEFVIIDTGNVNDPENARLYMRNTGNNSGTDTPLWSYITDMSGAIGMQGPIGPQGEPGPKGDPGPQGEGLNSLEIGGRNLYTGTRDFSGDNWISQVSWSKEDETYNGFSVRSYNARWNGLYQSVDAKSGDYFVLSGYFKAEAGSRIQAFFALDLSTTSPKEKEIAGTSDDVTDWTHFSVKFKKLVDGKIAARIENAIDGKKLCVCGLKLERGNVATDWTPAPEDLLPVDGTAASASKLASPRSINLTGGVTGSAAFDGSADVSIKASVPAMPAGAVIPYAGSAIPKGFLLCVGQAVSRVEYAALFAAIGTQYGAGDGSGTFNLPDMRARFPLGASSSGYGLGAKGGESNHVLTVSEIPAHGHTITNSVGITANTGANGTVQGGYKMVSKWNTISTGGAQDGYGVGTYTTDSTGGGSGHNNMPPYLSLNYIIATGVY